MGDFLQAGNIQTPGSTDVNGAGQSPTSHRTEDARRLKVQSMNPGRTPATLRFVLLLLSLTSTVQLLNGRYLQIPSGLSFTKPKLHQMIQRLKFAEQVRSKEDINKNDMLQKYLCIFSQSLSLLYPIYIANVWGVVVFYAALRSAEVGVEWGNRRYRHLIRNTSK